MSANHRVCALVAAAFMSLSPAIADAPGSRPGPPAGVPADWWSQVQRSIQLEEYAVAAEGTTGTEFRAANPAHRFDARFDGAGVRLAPVGGDWEWGLSLTRWGRPGTLDAAAAPALSATGDRVELARGALTEWFVNSLAGLEHGFTVPAPPRGDGDRLVFDIAVAGGLRPVFAEDGQAVDFFAAGEVGVLRYAKLVVTDAAGEVLPARMEPIVGGLRIVVEDSRATYPITVDPLATAPAWTAVGEVVGDRFGESVATAGDVNGDGYSDVVVGAEAFASFTGKAYLYLGGASGLSATPAWTAAGENTSNFFGSSVASAGDVNGDGYSDVVVGAYGFATNTGKAYLYLGGASGLSATPAWTAVGGSTDNFFGFSVATAGDVNGDAYSDVVVGAIGFASTGKAYLYLGGASGLSPTPAWTAAGDATSSYGISVATAGDVNGDGYSDVVVGAYAFATFTGKAFLYLGGASGLSPTPAWTAVGQTTNSSFGLSVSTAGDVNGDGYSDLVVGSPNHNSTGKAYLYLGGAIGLSASPAWTAAGESTNNFFGGSVATAGDVNGDGYSDVIVGAESFATSTGKAYLYLGGASGLSVATGWTAAGENTSNHFGHSVATAGDVNGDGYSDVIVGADYFATDRGKAYLYLGGASGLSVATGWIAAGESTNNFFGVSLATAGDVNGDGYSDVVVGADGFAGNWGKAYLYLGGASGLSPAPAWTAEGEVASNHFGISVATAGDVNGDGYSDVVVGADGFATFKGKAYLYLGGASGLSPAPAWTAVGENINNAFGHSVATAGDVNGDGYSDVVVGAYGFATNTGKAYLYLGGASGLSPTSAWTALGESTGNGFGVSLASAGDVNGDGNSDLVVGAPGHTTGRGKAYLYLGGASGLSATSAWTAVGESTNNFFGGSVATAGDVNGDGYSDVGVGAEGFATNTGKAYLYLGGTSGLSATSVWTAAGENTSNLFGHSVATAGDVNGDGYSDVVVGAYFFATNTGKAYLYLGGASGPSVAIGWTAAGEAANHYFGASVASAGDVNGDGYSDVVVGAYGFANSTGKAYLYFGGGGDGSALLPRQLRSDLSAPIHAGGPAFEQRFRLGLTLRSPVGRVWRKLQWQIAPFGGTFAPSVNPIQSDSNWFGQPVARTLPVDLPEDLQRYVWRARITYHPTQSPFLPRSPWFSISANGRRETDVLSRSETAPPACGIPDERLYITTVTLDGNGKPVIHYQDPNQPSDVTGYNIYRAASPAGPWVLLGSNVVDMDAGTPNKQYVDQTGNIGGPWFYQVAAWNQACGAEGPR